MTITHVLPSSRLSVCGSIAVARKTCSANCYAHHASWRIFRRTGLKATPGWHRGFFRAVLSDQTFPAERPARILICAASDEAMISVIFKLMSSVWARWHMVDACDTPLALAETFAARHGIELTVYRQRLPGLPDNGVTYDVIVTDGLLSLLPRCAQREALLGELARRLTKGGIFNSYSCPWASTGIRPAGPYGPVPDCGRDLAGSGCREIQDSAERPDAHCPSKPVLESG